MTLETMKKDFEIIKQKSKLNHLTYKIERSKLKEQIKNQKKVKQNG